MCIAKERQLPLPSTFSMFLRSAETKLLKPYILTCRRYIVAPPHCKNWLQSVNDICSRFQPSTHTALRYSHGVGWLYPSPVHERWTFLASYLCHLVGHGPGLPLKQRLRKYLPQLLYFIIGKLLCPMLYFVLWTIF